MSGVDFDADADDIEEPRPATEPEDGRELLAVIDQMRDSQ